jgi:hypothetical protein
MDSDPSDNAAAQGLVAVMPWRLCSGLRQDFSPDLRSCINLSKLWHVDRGHVAGSARSISTRAADCAAELTETVVRGEPWWSVGFEAGGSARRPGRARRHACLVFAQPLPSAPSSRSGGIRPPSGDRSPAAVPVNAFDLPNGRWFLLSAKEPRRSTAGMRQ